jgi:hypothetical protein
MKPSPSIRWALLGISYCLMLVPNQLNGQSQLTQDLQQRLIARKKGAKPTASTSTAKPLVPAALKSNSSQPVGEKSTSGQSGGSPDPRSTGIGPSNSPQAFSEALAVAVASNSLTAFNDLISWKTILQRSTRSLSGKWVNEFKGEFQKQLNDKLSLGAQIISSVQAGGSYDFLRLKKTQDTVVAVFRMILPGGRGVNYHEYALAKTSEGKVLASDIYIFLAGERLSDSIRRNLILSIDEKEKSTIRLPTPDQLLLNSVDTIKKLTESLSKNDAENARRWIMELPEAVRSDKAIQSLTLRTYSNSTSFPQVSDRIRRSNPEDVFMDMLAIDILASQKKYDDAMNAIDRISRRVGGDPHLDILKGRMHLRKGEKQIARKIISDAIMLDDGLLSGYWNLISFSLQDKNHKETLRLLKLIDRKFKIKFRDLREIPSYASFINTPEFKDWDRQQKIGQTTSGEKAPTSQPKVDVKSSPKTTSGKRTALRGKQISNLKRSRN